MTTPHADPLIDEVRQRRRELLAHYDNDLGKLLAAVRQCQAEHPERVVDRRRLREASKTTHLEH